MESNPSSLGPFGLRMGQAHHIAYLVAAIVMGSICLFSTIITFILAKTENDLKQRGRYLVFWNGLSATGVVTIYLMLNSFAGNFPCFLLLWTSYMCTVPWLLTYLARGWRLVYIYNQQVNFGNRIIQRNSTRDNLGPNLGPIARGDEGPGISESDHAPSSSQNGLAISGSEDVRGEAVTDECIRPIPVDVTSVLNLDAPLPPLPIPKSTSPLLPKERGAFINNITTSTISPSVSVSTSPRIPLPAKPEDTNDEFSRTINPLTGINIFPDSNGITLSRHNIQGIPAAPRDSPSNVHDNFDQPTSMNFDTMQVESRHRWNRFLPFNQATDSRLAVFLIACMIIPFGVCLGMQFVKPSPVQINPISYKCGEGAVFYPIYIIMLAFLALGCPILIWKLWWIKDGFGIRNELFITMVIGLPGFVLYFVSPFRFKRLDSGHWNHVNWLVLTIFLAQVNSVVLPLIQFYMRQRPKQRSDSSKGSGRPFASILRWDSPKATPGTPNVDLHSDASSFRSHAQSPPQFMSPQLQSRPLEACDSSLYERQSLAQQSVVEVGNKDDDGPSAPINRSVTKNGRTRGMKGFWTKYGKDSDGNIIPLSRMDPRAFEYALQDGEMLGELVKFSITVFSAENTKFLQEYDGLRKQVREYYRLAGYGSSRSPKHSHSASDTSGSIANALGGLAPGLDLSSKPSRKKLSNLVSLTSSVHSKLSSHGLAGTMEDSPKSSRHESRIESIAEWGEEIPRSDGDPGSSTGVSVYALYPMKSFGKHRQDMKGSLWRLSLHSSLRNSNSPYVSPYGPVQEEVDGEIHQIGSSSLVMSPSKLATGQYHQQKESLGDRTFQSDSTISTLDDVDESRHGFGENDSERSSFSWYGRGNTGSTISYHDVTPSEISSYHDTGSEVIQLPMGYFGDVGSLVDYHQTDDLDVSIAGEPLNNKQEDTSNANGALFPPTPISSEKTTSSSSSKDTDASSSPYYSISEPCPKFVPGHSTSYSLGSYPIGYMTTDRLREGLPPPMHQKQSSRLAHPVNRSPFHSPSSSVSATFSPRLPLQPQSHSPNSIRPMPPTLQRSSSARNVLTAKDFQQLQSEADSITSVTPTGTPNQVPFNDLPQARRPSPLQRSASSPKRSSSSHSWSQIRARPIPGASTLSEVYRMSKAKLANNNDGIDVSNINGKTLVPKALLPAYWEICQTFIMPNSVLELNLSEHHVTKVKDLFLTSKCYLEMYESIAKEVQELVYSNVWPRFIQSIQRQPQGFSGKFKRTWNTFFGKEPEDQGDAIFEGNSNRIAGWLHRSRVHDTEQSNRGATSPSSQDYLSQNVDAMELGSLHPMPVPTPLPPPPQASYIHGQYSYLGLEEDEGAFPGESQARTENSDMEQLDLGRFGVMQELDFTALQHIMIDPK